MPRQKGLQTMLKKRIRLHRETLRSLETGALAKAAGGGTSANLPSDCPLASCTYCNHTACHTCIC
jgi:hypothetical protein